MGFAGKGSKGPSKKTAEEWVAEAAGVVREQIRGDQRRVEHPLRTLLGYIGDHFAGGKLTVTGAMQACGFADHTLPLRFHREIGIPPGAYIEDCQMELAARLIESPWPGSISEIGDLIGFANLPGFSRAFERWSGLRPSVYRRKVAELRESGQAIPGAETLRSRFLASLENGRAAPEVRAEVAQWVKVLHPAHEAGRPAVDPILAAAEPELAERVWLALRELPPAQQREGLRHAAVFTSPAFFEHLARMSRVEGRDDRRRGVFVAEMALESLKPLVWYFSPVDFGHLQARGWAALGNARALAWQLDLAEEAFSQADKLVAAFEPAPVGLCAEIQYLKSCLRASQRRWNDALELACDADDLARRAGSGELKAQILMQRGAVLGNLDRLAEAIADFEASAQILPTSADPYLQLAAQANLAMARADAGFYPEAMAALREAKVFSSASGSLIPTHLRWLEALLAITQGDEQIAETVLVEICEHFRARGESGQLAIASLDLARVALRQGRAQEVPAILEIPLSLVDSLKMDAETLTVLRLLREALRDTCAGVAGPLHRLRERLATSLGVPALRPRRGMP